MIINKYGIAFDGVEIPDNAVISNVFRVRVMKVDAEGNRHCVGEEDYVEFPSNDSIAYCITKYNGGFAVIENVHFIDKSHSNDDPFEECHNCTRPREDCEQRICPTSRLMDELELEAYRHQENKE